MRKTALLLCAVLAFVVPRPSAVGASSDTSDGGDDGGVVIDPQQRRDRAYELLVGTSDKTQWAIVQALVWLAENQNDDGSWGEEPLQPAMTGLGLLCVLGYGQDHLSAAFGATVRSAINWLVEHQGENGSFVEGPNSATQHGIATYAMAEAYAMTGLKDLRPVVAKAIRHICDGQTDEGGWYENYAKADENGKRLEGGDTCVSGWQIQALTAAWLAGIRFSNNMLRDALPRAVADMKSRFDPQTGFGDRGTRPSRTEEENYCTTAIGALCLQLLEHGQSKEVKAAVETMRTYTCDWQETDAGPPGPLLKWYYVTQAMYLAADDPKKNEYWKYWNPLLGSTILDHQQDDGHWEFPESGGGQREKAQFEGQNGIVYPTALCCLALEVYYSYLQAYRPPYHALDKRENRRAPGVLDGRDGRPFVGFVVTPRRGELDVDGRMMSKKEFLKELSELAQRNPRMAQVRVFWSGGSEQDDVISLVRALIEAHVLVTVVPPEPDLPDIIYIF